MDKTGKMRAVAVAVAIALGAPLAAVLATVLGSAPAHGLGLNTCGTQDQISEELIEEGHALVAGMESHVFNPDSGKFQDVAIMLTATANRAAWYLITGDRPFGFRSNQYCVTVRGTALKILSSRGEGANPVSRYGFDREKAEKECAAVNGSSETSPECGAFDDVLAEMQHNYGAVPVLQGRIVTAKGAARGVLTIVADPDNERDYRRLFSSPTGATGILEFGKSFFFAPEVLDALDGGR